MTMWALYPTHLHGGGSRGGASVLRRQHDHPYVRSALVTFTHLDFDVCSAAHVPFDLHGRESVHPVRVALATLWSICKNGEYSWYEGAVALLDYVREQFPGVSTPSYDRFMVDIRLKVKLRMDSWNIYCKLRLKILVFL